MESGVYMFPKPGEGGKEAERGYVVEFEEREEAAAKEEGKEGTKGDDIGTGTEGVVVVVSAVEQ